MEIYGEISDKLAGDGMIIIDGRDVALIPYSLTLATAPGRLVAKARSADRNRCSARSRGPRA